LPPMSCVGDIATERRALVNGSYDGNVTIID